MRRRRCARAATRPGRASATGRRRAGAPPRRDTCGAANDVPIASRSSNGPQSEYASVQPESLGDEVRRDRREHVVAGRRDVDVDRVAVRVVGHGAVAANRARRRSRAAARRDTPRTRHGVDGDCVPFPTAATTTTPFEYAYSTAARSSGEYVSSDGLSGSRTPPRLRLMTRAPWSTAQRIAATSAGSETSPSAATTFATIRRALNARPAMPIPFAGLAAISPATNVPCPCSSWYGEPPTNDLRCDDASGEIGMRRRRCRSR